MMGAVLLVREGWMGWWRLGGHGEIWTPSQLDRLLPYLSNYDLRLTLAAMVVVVVGLPLLILAGLIWFVRPHRCRRCGKQIGGLAMTLLSGRVAAPYCQQCLQEGAD